MNLDDKIAVASRDGWRCQATGMHHEDCPGEASSYTAFQFCAHHMFERWRGKRDRAPVELVDAYSNLILVWNGQTGLGAGGCHQKIHTEIELAQSLGLLRTTLDP